MSEELQNEFEEFHWRGQKRYKCNRTWKSGASCEFDAYDLTEMRKHVSQPHGEVVVRLQRTSPLVDADGRTIVYGDAAEVEGLRFKPEE